MKNVRFNFLILILLSISILFSSCNSKERDYYAEESNYICVTGVINHIKYNEDETALYLGFSDLTAQFDDNCFKIVGENLTIVRQNGIDAALAKGLEVEFISAPRYFGDGYVMPIVGLSIGETVYLEYEVGYTNFLKWLETQN